MAFRIRDLMISVLPAAAADAQGGCVNCTGTTPQPRGCVNCTGTTPAACFQGTVGGCPNCTGTTGPHVNAFAMPGCVNCSGTTNAFIGFGCPNCSGTTGGLTGDVYACHGWSGGCPNCTGTTGGFCAHAAALMACGACTGVSPALGDQRPQALALLRQQLQDLLSQVEAEERQLADAAFPQTAEEVEALEKKLEEALAEVRSRKAGSGGGKKKKG
jgi:hypothetical protein